MDKYLISASLPTLFIVLHEDDSDHNNKDILEEVCEEQKDIIYCGYIEKKNEIYKGAHDFLRQDGNNTAVSVVKD